MYWGGGYGYYNTMEVKISVNKEQFFLQYFLYNMQDLKMGSFFLVSEKIDKKYWKIVASLCVHQFNHIAVWLFRIPVNRKIAEWFDLR